VIGVIATLRIQDGKAQAFEDAFRELSAQVKANEPGCLAYQLTKSRSDPNTYKVLELYTGEEAVTHHGNTPYFQAAGPKLGATLAAIPDIEYLDAVE
jgi:quinol monooxygenase YgiN